MTAQEKIDFLKSAMQSLKIIKAGQDLEFTSNTKLADLGVDSLDAIELQMYYEEVTGIETADPTGAVDTVGDLLNLMP